LHKKGIEAAQGKTARAVAALPGGFHDVFSIVESNKWE
jgi:hypothetical protein